jgi:hypothetical protein
MQVAVLGIDLGKNSCSVAGLDTSGRVVLRRRLHRDSVVKLASRLPACVMAMEACCGAHHLARLLQAYGHEIRLMSPEYVQPYVKAQKNDVYGPPPLCKGFRSMKANTALAVVYPASKRGDTAAGPDGFRGSTAGQMDELGSSSHRSLTFVEPGPTGSPSSFVTLASQRRGSGVDRVTLPAGRRRAGDRIHHGSTLPRARGPSCVPQQWPRRSPDVVAKARLAIALVERPYETRCHV